MPLMEDLFFQKFSAYSNLVIGKVFFYSISALIEIVLIFFLEGQ